MSKEAKSWRTPLAMEPRLYNNLFRRYPEGSDMLRIDVPKAICTISPKTAAMRSRKCLHDPVWGPEGGIP